MGDNIVYTRWVVYFVFGLPFLAWLFFTKSNVLRVISVLAVLIFIQNSISARRYLWAIGVGPSNIVAYVALISLFLQRKGRLSLQGIGIPWAFYLFLAFAGLLIGATRPGELLWNVIAFQEYYVEGFFFFLIGVVAFTKDEELDQFFTYFVMIGIGVAVIHLFCLATGFHFVDWAQAGEVDSALPYGGVFNNPNTMGSFYCMVLPTALLMAANGRNPVAQRTIASAGLVLMLGSLLISTHRGGILVCGFLFVMMLLLNSANPARGLVAIVFGAVALAVGILVLRELIPDLVDEAVGMQEYEGLSTSRLWIWTSYLTIIAQHPFGVGVTTKAVLDTAAKYNIPFAPHNVYLGIAMQIGILGLIMFLIMAGVSLARGFRAWRITREPRRRLVLTYVFIAQIGWLLAGISETLFENGYKMNQLYWFFLGLSLATSGRVLAEARRGGASQQAPVALEEATAHGL